MSLSIPTAIVAHKFLVAIALVSLLTTGGAVAYEQSSNTLGTMSFQVNSGIGITSIGQLSLGTLSPGQTKMSTTSAQVNVTSTGNYTISLASEESLHEAFSSFNVSINGFGSPVSLNLTNDRQIIHLNAGIYNLKVNVALTVSSDLNHSINATSIPFLSLGNLSQGHMNEMPSIAQGNHDYNGEGNEGD